MFIPFFSKSKKPTTMPEEVQRTSLEQAKIEIEKIKQDFSQKLVYSSVPSLDSKHLSNCRLLPSRHHLLELMPRDSVCAEVGVLFGDFSQSIIDICHPKHLHLIDLSSSLLENVKDRFKNEILQGTVATHLGNSYDVLATFPDNFFDWIYLDGDHSYETVKNELIEAHRIVKSNSGYILLNDYIFFDHIQNTKYGVIEATNEFCLEYNYEFAYFTFHDQMFCDVALRKIQ